MGKNDKPQIYVCAVCSVVILPKPGICGSCSEYFKNKKPKK